MEHNTGNIFDKDPNLVMGQHLSDFLDLKFQTSNPQELIDFIKDRKVLTEQEIQHFEQIFETIAKLKQSPTKTASYE